MCAVKDVVLDFFYRTSCLKESGGRRGKNVECSIF